jgi:hypothetical protein
LSQFRHLVEWIESSQPEPRADPSLLILQQLLIKKKRYAPENSENGTTEQDFLMQTVLSYINYGCPNLSLEIIFAQQQCKKDQNDRSVSRAQLDTGTFDTWNLASQPGSHAVSTQKDGLDIVNSVRFDVVTRLLQVCY